MVEAVNNVQVQPVTKKDNSVRNGVIAGTVGLVGAGSIGYSTKQIMKEGAFTDEFVKGFQNNAFNDVVAGTPEMKKVAYSLFNMEENPTIDAVKKFFQKHEKDLVEESNPNEIRELLQSSDEEIMDTFKGLKEIFDTRIGPKLKAIPEIIMGWMEEGENQFKPKESLKDISLYKAALKTQREIKGKVGLIWGAISGLVLGIGAYASTKIFGKSEA